MMTQPKNKKRILYYMVYIMFSLGPIALIAVMLGVKLPLIKLLGYIFVIQQLSALVTFYPISIFFIGTFILIGYILIQQVHPEWLGIFSQTLSDFLLNIENYTAGYDLLDPLNSIIAMIMIGCCISILSLLIVYKFKRDRILFISFLLYMIYAWYNYIDSAYGYILIYIASYAMLHTLKRFNVLASSDSIVKIRGIDAQFQEWIRFSFRYIIIILVVALLLPKGGNFVEWQWLENQLINLIPSLEDLRQETQHMRTFTSAELFSFEQTGFLNDDGQLGGPVELNESIAFVVDSPYPLYLRGNILSTYDGKSWTHGNRIKVEQKTGVQLRPELYSGEEISLKITNKNLSSFTLFAPYQPLSVTIERMGKIWIDANHEITLLGARYKNESYTITSFLPSKTQADISTPTSILFNKEDYLKLPNTLPTRVKELAIELTISADDQKLKAKNIISYLRQHYTYTLEPNTLPAGEDFVDYFLFETREGYCTYFATSLCILLRSIDIPTRYVEGFRMPEQKTNDYYEVRFSNGHAWVEAYFDDCGWVTLEATPAFTPPIEPQDVTILTTYNNSNLYNFDDESAYLLSLKQDRLENLNAFTYNNLTDYPNKNNIQHLYGRLIDKLPITVLLIFLITISMRILYMSQKYKTYHYKLINNPFKGIYVYGNILVLFEHINIHRTIGETPREFSKRIKRHFYDFDHDFENITELYIRLKYSNTMATTEEYNKILDFYYFADKRVHYKIGHINYFYKKYVLGHFINFYNDLL